MLKKYNKDVNGQKDSRGQFGALLIVFLTTTAGVDFNTGINLNKFVKAR